MEFCIIGGDLSVLPPGITPSLKRGQVAIFARGAPVNEEAPLALYDGHIMHPSFASSSCFDPRLSAIPSFQKQPIETIRGLLRECAGVFVGLLEDIARRKTVLQLDPLSIYPLLTAKRQGVSLIANSAAMMEEGLAAIGSPPKRLMAFALSEIFFGGAGDDMTGFEGVQLSPMGYSLEFDWDTGRLDTSRESALDAKEKTTSVEEACDKAVASFRQIYDSYGAEHCCLDLTGGLDSRTVLALALKADIQKPHIFFSVQQDPRHPDSLIPSAIAAHFGLEKADFPENYNGENLTEIQVLRRAAARGQGIASLYEHELGRFKIGTVARIRGGVGEILREYYPRARMAKPFRGWLRSIFRNGRELGYYRRFRNVAATSYQNGFEKDVYAARTRKKKLGNEFPFLQTDLLLTCYQGNKKLAEDCASFSDTIDDLPGLFYMARRARRHFGHSSMMLNRVRPSFEPLTNIHLWRLSRRYSFEDRQRGTLAGDVLRYLAPDLLQFPCTTHVSAIRSNDLSMIKDAPTPPKAAFKAVPPPEIDHSSPLVEDFRRLALSLSADQANENFIDLARFQAWVSAPEFDQVYRQHHSDYRRFHKALYWLTGEDEDIPLDKNL